jgi:HD-GYP domain-containing protein (c-di-GMP phosphodiesterase class II)
MREHVRLGARILEPIAAYARVIPVVLQHHEYFDGEGYPGGLAGEAIHIGARIFAVADSFDALTSDRPYRHAIDSIYAIETIKQGAGSRYDPNVVQAFLEVMAQEVREGDVDENREDIQDINISHGIVCMPMREEDSRSR